MTVSRKTPPSNGPWLVCVAAATVIALGLTTGCDDVSPPTSTAPTSTAPTSTASSAIAASANAASSASSKTAAEQVSARATLTFSIEGRKVRSVRQEELIRTVGTVQFTAYDPYYTKPKTFRALPIDKVLAHGFRGESVDLKTVHFVLRATDGYTVPIEGSRLLEEGGHIAIDDIDHPNGWQPIGPGQVSPAPYYLVWSKETQKELVTHPRPWQLATIEISKFETSFPKTVPSDLPKSDKGWAGFELFRQRCIRCHAINQEGGRVGPELNVPQNITEYRPAQQIRDYITNPRKFRYGNMPANPDLTRPQLDSLLAYLHAMKDRKQDPGPPGTDH